MIQFDGLSQWYKTRSGKNYIFRDVSLQLPMDKSVGVLGRNGAGKSTLIRLMGGAEMPKSGRLKTDLRISWPLGLQGGAMGSISGRENARFIARIHGIRESKAMEQRVADFAEIGRYFDEPMKTYSSGMRARVMLGITMALDFQFDVLLIDEITAVGDAHFRAKSEQVLKERFSTTRVIMVNHSLDQLSRFCEAGLLIKDGTLEYFDQLDNAIRAYKAS